MGWHVMDLSSVEFEEREPRQDEARGRLVADLTTTLALTESRARLWRYPPQTTGRRHAERAQEEVFVVLRGQLTMLLGDPAQRVDVNAGGIVAVEAGTPLQVRSESADELLLFIYGAPPVEAGADFFADTPLPAQRD